MDEDRPSLADRSWTELDAAITDQTNEPMPGFPQPSWAARQEGVDLEASRRTVIAVHPLAESSHQLERFTKPLVWVTIALAALTGVLIGFAATG
jgi:hypothetical protein